MTNSLVDRLRRGVYDGENARPLLTEAKAEIERLRTGLRQLAHKAGEEFGGFHSVVTFAEELLDGGSLEPLVDSQDIEIALNEAHDIEVAGRPTAATAIRACVEAARSSVKSSAEPLKRRYSAEDYERVIAAGGNMWSTLERLREMAMENHGKVSTEES